MYEQGQPSELPFNDSTPYIYSGEVFSGPDVQAEITAPRQEGVTDSSEGVSDTVHSESLAIPSGTTEFAEIELRGQGLDLPTLDKPGLTKALSAHMEASRNEQPPHATQPTDEEWNSICRVDEALGRVAAGVGLYLPGRELPREAYHFYDNREDMSAVTPQRGGYHAAKGLSVVRMGDPVARDSIIMHEKSHRLTNHAVEVAVTPDDNNHMNVDLKSVQVGLQYGDQEVGGLNEAVTDMIMARTAAHMGTDRVVYTYLGADYIATEAVHEAAARLGVSSEVIASRLIRDACSGEEVAYRALVRGLGAERTNAILSMDGLMSAEQAHDLAIDLELPRAAQLIDVASISPAVAAARPFNW